MLSKLHQVTDSSIVSTLVLPYHGVGTVPLFSLCPCSHEQLCTSPPLLISIVILRSTLPSIRKKIRTRCRRPPHKRFSVKCSSLSSCDSPNTSRRLVQAMPACSVKTGRDPSLHCRDARVYGPTTRAMHYSEHTPATNLATLWIYSALPHGMQFSFVLSFSVLRLCYYSVEGLPLRLFIT